MGTWLFDRETNKLENKSIEILDIVLVIAKYKRLLAAVFFASVVVAYLSIFFLIKPEFTASATIIPSGGSGPMSGLMSLAGKFSGMMPSISGSIKNDDDFGMYSTILYSRVSMENVIDKFSLMKLYKFKNKEIAVRSLRKQIQADVTLDNAYTITCRFGSPELASDITNYLVKYLNEKVIAINIGKSKNDRIFLESRLLSVKESLRNAEELLVEFQERTGIIEVKSQASELVQRFSEIESQLAKKDLELRVSKNLGGDQSNEFKLAKISTTELKRDLEKFKTVGTSNLKSLPMDSLPKTFLGYTRLYREVEIYKMMLEYLTPVYEQAKFDEQKLSPVLNVIDDAVPPIKRTYPKRTVSALLIAILITGLLTCILILKERSKSISNPKLLLIKKELFGSPN